MLHCPLTLILLAHCVSYLSHHGTIHNVQEEFAQWMLEGGTSMMWEVSIKLFWCVLFCFASIFKFKLCWEKMATTNLQVYFYTYSVAGLSSSNQIEHRCSTMNTFFFLRFEYFFTASRICKILLMVPNKKIGWKVFNTW